jgi:hypothetical protein
VNDIGALALVLLAAAAAGLILRPQSKVAQEQRLVIFRLGRFHRISGPGVVWLLAGIEKIADWHNTANQPRNLWVSNLLIRGIDASLNVNLWVRTDLVEAAGNDKSKLAELATLHESAREGQVAVEVKRAMDDGLAAIEAAHPLGPNATLPEKIAVLLPTSALRDELLTSARDALAPRLREFGVILDPTKRISITQVLLPDDVVEALSHARLLDSLNQQRPDAPPGARTHAAASSEGGPKLVITSQGGAAGVLRERPPRPDGSSAPPAPQARELSKDDLRVLRTVPPVHREAPRTRG